MKKTLLALLLILIFASCAATLTTKVEKTRTIATFQAIHLEGKWHKGRLLMKTSSGNYPNGNQKYFVDLSETTPSDTTFWEDLGEVKKKAINGYNHFFDHDGNAIRIEKESGDTTFVYDTNLDKPMYYMITTTKNGVERFKEFRVFGDVPARESVVQWIDTTATRPIYVTVEELVLSEEQLEQLSDEQQADFAETNRLYKYFEGEIEFY